MNGQMIKRLFDILFALLVSIFCIPVVVVGIVFVKLISPGSPALFKQKRVGRNGRLFTIYKLRSMTNECDGQGKLLPDEIRLKPWGKLIRGSNIDELPQILNILKGEMSWIGPRPLLPHEMDVMTNDEQELRQSVFPGISGWEAVNERYSETRRQMIDFDLFYVRNWSLRFDIKIFFMTAFIVLLKLRPGDSGRAPKILEEELVYREKDIRCK